MDGKNKYAADIHSIKEAQLRIAPFIHTTPVLSSSTLDSLAAKQLFFKCECFQKGLVSVCQILFYSIHLLFLLPAFNFNACVSSPSTSTSTLLFTIIIEELSKLGVPPMLYFRFMISKLPKGL